MEKPQNQKISFNELLEVNKDASRLQLYKKQFYAFCEKYCGVKSLDEKVADEETWMECWFADWRNHAEEFTGYLDDYLNNREAFEKNTPEKDKAYFKKHLSEREIFDMHDLAENRNTGSV